jgi:hypothetical protein
MPVLLNVPTKTKDIHISEVALYVRKVEMSFPRALDISSLIVVYDSS